MGSSAMLFIPSFIKTGSGIQKLIGGDSKTHGEHGIHICLKVNGKVVPVLN
jgi:hypothetical protein